MREILLAGVFVHGADPQGLGSREETGPWLRLQARVVHPASVEERAWHTWQQTKPDLLHLQFWSFHHSRALGSTIRLCPQK